MPKLINDVDKFLEMSEDAEECRVKRGSDHVKLKLRTKKYLYTIVVEPQKAEEIIQQVKCQVVEALSLISGTCATLFRFSSFSANASQDSDSPCMM
ncbi:MAG: hypothetical protein ACW99X_17160 [Candidatus Thorarchaeota archaeon]